MFTFIITGKNTLSIEIDVVKWPYLLTYISFWIPAKKQEGHSTGIREKCAAGNHGFVCKKGISTGMHFQLSNLFSIWCLWVFLFSHVTFYALIYIRIANEMVSCNSVGGGCNAPNSYKHDWQFTSSVFCCNSNYSKWDFLCIFLLICT